MGFGDSALQDRLVKELRLAGISTVKEADEFLIEYIPKFNKQFSVAPRSRNNLHKIPSQELKQKLSQIFSIQSPRKVNNDYTIMFKNRFFQLAEIQPTTVYKKDTVIVEEHLNGEIKINRQDHYLNYQVLPERPAKQKILLPALTGTKSPWKPPANHPWRRQFLRSKIQEKQFALKS